jgi:FMN phosphatase YigB (HAD superfamily)
MVFLGRRRATAGYGHCRGGLRTGDWRGKLLARAFDPRPASLPAMTASSHDVVFLVDVDNTLLDNDRVVDDLREHLASAFGAESAGVYWTRFEQLRAQLGYADYLGALQLYRHDVEHDGVAAHALLRVSGFLLDYPFRERVFAGAFDALAHLARFGPTVILSDGDVVFQPRKIVRSGLWDAVDGRVLIHVHKETMLDEVRRAFPARHYAIVDDKPRILGAFKAAWGAGVTTVFPRQGHYAHDAAEFAKVPPPDVAVDRIGELARTNIAGWIPSRSPP